MIILGGGESGVGAALLAAQRGYDVFVSDGGALKDEYRQTLTANRISFEEGGHTDDRILDAAEVMKSPGIPEKNELVKKIRAKGIPVISEIELAYRYKGDSRVIGITGSNRNTSSARSRLAANPSAKSRVRVNRCGWKITVHFLPG